VSTPASPVEALSRLGRRQDFWAGAPTTSPSTERSSPIFLRNATLFRRLRPPLAARTGAPSRRWLAPPAPSAPVAAASSASPPPAKPDDLVVVLLCSPAALPVEDLQTTPWMADYGFLSRAVRSDPRRSAPVPSLPLRLPGAQLPVSSMASVGVTGGEADSHILREYGLHIGRLVTAGATFPWCRRGSSVCRRARPARRLFDGRARLRRSPREALSARTDDRRRRASVRGCGRRPARLPDRRRLLARRQALAAWLPRQETYWFPRLPVELRNHFVRRCFAVDVVPAARSRQQRAVVRHSPPQVLCRRLADWLAAFDWLARR